MRFALIAMLAACGGGMVEATPKNTTLYRYSLASQLTWPTYAVRERLVPGTPPRESERVDCAGALVEISFARMRDPENGSQYIHDVRISAVDPKGFRVTAEQAGEPLNHGNEVAEMVMEVSVGVWKASNSFRSCSYVLSATTKPAIRKE